MFFYIIYECFYLNLFCAVVIQHIFIAVGFNLKEITGLYLVSCAFRMTPVLYIDVCLYNLL